MQIIKDSGKCKVKVNAVVKVIKLHAVKLKAIAFFLLTCCSDVGNESMCVDLENAKHSRIFYRTYKLTQ